MIRAAAATVILATLSVLSFACSDDIETQSASVCKKNPNAAGCPDRVAAAPPNTSSPAPSARASTPAPTPSTPPPVAADAGYHPAPLPSPDGGLTLPPLTKPDGGAPVVPLSFNACRELLRCCERVIDNVERAGCYAIGYNASESTCANGVIAYQVFGGCDHDPVSLPDIFNPDGSRDQSKDCTYLQNVCAETGDCEAAYACAGGTAATPPPETDPCYYEVDHDDSCGRNPYYCCTYGGSYFCGYDANTDYSYCY